MGSQNDLIPQHFLVYAPKSHSLISDAEGNCRLTQIESKHMITLMSIFDLTRIFKPPKKGDGIKFFERF